MVLKSSTAGCRCREFSRDLFVESVSEAVLDAERLDAGHALSAACICWATSTQDFSRSTECAASRDHLRVSVALAHTVRILGVRVGCDNPEKSEDQPCKG